MDIVTRGSGQPLVLITGLQGRWEYLRSAVDALAQSFRVVTFSLAGERSSARRLDPSRGLDNYVEQILTALDAQGLDRAVICGVSFGGLVAVRFAAVRPERVEGLVLVSTPGPTWRVRPRHQLYARNPWLFGPLFLAETPFRLRKELVAAYPERKLRWRFALRQLGTLVRTPLSLGRMAERGRMLSKLDVLDDCNRITAPTLVITGEQNLDYVVNGSSEYLQLISGARGAVIERTGHIGTLTRPERFAEIVCAFFAARGLAPSRREPPHDRLIPSNHGSDPHAA